jgi:hypothetical protein
VVAVLSMSKQGFSRLDLLLRVQSGRLRVGDACVLIGLQRAPGVPSAARPQAKRGPRACFPNVAADPVNIGSLLRFAPWRCRSCASDMSTMARPPAFALRYSHRLRLIANGFGEYVNPSPWMPPGWGRDWEGVNLCRCTQQPKARKLMPLPR